MKKLKDAPKNIWEYEQESYNKLTEKDVEFSEMEESERRFVHGAVRYFKPKRILEVGVAEGGGSIVLLNAIEDMLDTTLTSIDLLDYFYLDHEKEVGFACKEKYGMPKQWDLHAGKDPSEIIESLGGERKFDFCIIDTAHTHPIESLNFLSVFPFLTEECVVILHDIGLYSFWNGSLDESDTLYSKFPSCYFATKLLFDSMVGEKRTLPVTKYSKVLPFSNIGLCQLTKETKKYMRDVVSMLEFPWGMIPMDTIDSMLSLIKRHYSSDIYEGIFLALQRNVCLFYNQKKNYLRHETNPSVYGKKKIIFYGYGAYLKNILPGQTWSFTEKVSEIWDKKAEILDKIPFEEKGYSVRTPDFFCPEKEDILIVITLVPKSEDIINKIKIELKKWFYLCAPLK